MNGILILDIRGAVIAFTRNQQRNFVLLLMERGYVYLSDYELLMILFTVMSFIVTLIIKFIDKDSKKTALVGKSGYLSLVI